MTSDSKTDQTIFFKYMFEIQYNLQATLVQWEEARLEIKRALDRSRLRPLLFLPLLFASECDVAFSIFNSMGTRPQTKTEFWGKLRQGGKMT